MPRLRIAPTLIILAALFALTISWLLPSSHAQGQVQVTAASPAAAEQGTINLNVKVNGKGFKNGARAQWFVTGTTDPGGVTVNSTTFVSSTELSANITVADTAVISNFDIQVLNSDGRGGKGTELFAVTAKGNNVVCPVVQPAPTSDTKCYAQSPGCLDLSFGGSGYVHTDLYPAFGTEETAGVVVQPDGKIVVAGRVGKSPPGYAFAVFRYNADGNLDTSFGDADSANPPLRLGYTVTTFTTGSDTARAMLLQPDGKIVVAGNALSATYMAAVRYNSDGSLDTSFGSGGKVTISFGKNIGSAAYDIAQQSDGKLMMVGNANNQFALARLNANGSLDASFASGGKLIVNASGTRGGSSFARSLSFQRIPAITGEERIVVGGYSTNSSSSKQDWTLMRFKPDGSTDTTFGSSGSAKTSFFGFDDQIQKVQVDSNNRIVAAGTTYSASGDCGSYVLDAALVRYAEDGNLDGSFAGGKQTVDVYGGRDGLYGLSIQADGKVLILATAKSADNSVTYIALVRFNADGSRDSTFGLMGNGIVTTALYGIGSWGYALTLQPTDGKVIVAGDVGNPPAGDDIVVVRYWS
jgi:uncharacterized delta-60 repeat protein